MHDRARALAALLESTAPLWRPAPFHGDPHWVDGNPALAAALLALDDHSVEELEQDPEKLQGFVAGLAPGVGDLVAAAGACIDPLPLPPPLPLPQTAGRDIPGRKWQQLLHFASACADHGNDAVIPGDQSVPVDVVEWCSGKAHLGRLLARALQRPVTAIEWNAALCADGSRLAFRDGLPVTFIQADVTRITPATAHLGPRVHAVALHACGDLHIALLRKGCEARVAALDVAPCCYHLTNTPTWQPLSTALTGTALALLPLSREDLRLAVQETVTSSPRVVRQQRTLAAWRLGFDTLQRELRGSDTYLPTPSRPLSVLTGGFGAFCADMAAHHGIDLPGDLAFARYEMAGRQRSARVRRLELPRHACRRALETLLAADRALFLADHGYEVSLRTFCPRPLTPRNLLIRARRSGAGCGNENRNLVLAP